MLQGGPAPPYPRGPTCSGTGSRRGRCFELTDFEDRALATSIETSFFADLAAELSVRAGVPLRDLGMVEGRGGFLVIWGTHAQDWAAPSLPPERQEQSTKTDGKFLIGRIIEIQS